MKPNIQILEQCKQRTKIEEEKLKKLEKASAEVQKSAQKGSANSVNQFVQVKQEYWQAFAEINQLPTLDQTLSSMEIPSLSYDQKTLDKIQEVIDSDSSKIVELLVTFYHDSSLKPMFEKIYISQNSKGSQIYDQVRQLMTNKKLPSIRNFKLTLSNKDTLDP